MHTAAGRMAGFSMAAKAERRLQSAFWHLSQRMLHTDILRQTELEFYGLFPSILGKVVRSCCAGDLVPSHFPGK